MRADDVQVVAVDVSLLAGEVGANGSPIILRASAFQMSQEIKLDVARLKHVAAGQWPASCTCPKDAPATASPGRPIPARRRSNYRFRRFAQ